jgi:hypothetical protein
LAPDQQVNPASTATTVTSSANPSSFGQSVTFTATVTNTATSGGSPTGSVEFYDGSTDLGPGSILSGSGSESTSAFTISTMTATTHSIRAVYTPSGTFLATTGTLDLTVDPAPLTITADADPSTAGIDAFTKVYGEPDPAFAVRYSGFVNGDTAGGLGGTLAFTTLATQASGVGSYDVTPGGLSSGNYAITYVAGTLSVTPAPLTITADDATKVYGAAPPTLGASYAGFVNGDTAASLAAAPTLRTAAIAASHVGAYAITASGAVDPDYTIGYVQGNLAITRARLTITADSQSIAFGAAPGPLTAQYVGFVNGDSPASLATLPLLSTTATPNSPAGAYPIVATGVRAPDYDITLVPGVVLVARYAPPRVPRIRARAAFVDTLYHEVLDRGPEPAGSFSWLRRLKQGVSPWTVAKSFWTSAERGGLIQSGRAPLIRLATACADARSAAREAFVVTLGHPVGPATAGWRGPRVGTASKPRR